MKKTLTVAPLILVILSLLLAKFFLNEARQNRPFDVKTSGLYYLPPGDFLKSVSLDNANSTADYFWINMILTIGQLHHEHDEDQAHEHHHGHECNHTEEEIEISRYLHNHLAYVLPNYVETITDLDPNFCYPYLIGFLFALQDYQNDNFAKSILEKAMENNPDYWEFPYFYAFYLNQNTATEDSVILHYLGKSVKAGKSIRVFRKDLVYETYLAFYNKLQPDLKSEKLLEGIIEAIDNPNLKEKLLSDFHNKRN